MSTSALARISHFSKLKTLLLRLALSSRGGGAFARSLGRMLPPTALRLSPRASCHAGKSLRLVTKSVRKAGAPEIGWLDRSGSEWGCCFLKLRRCLGATGFRF